MENIINKIIEIEDFFGDTIMAIETDKDGKIVNLDECSIANIDTDYRFNTNKDLVRIQSDKVPLKHYTTCLIEWEDDKTQEEVIIKSTTDCTMDEDEKIFFYGLTLNNIKDCISKKTLCENEWKILKIIDIKGEL